jgi:hypothetical protein
MTAMLVFLVILLAITNGWLAYSQQSLRRRIYLFLDRTMEGNKVFEEIAADREMLRVLKDNVDKHMQYIETLGEAMRIYESETKILSKNKEKMQAIQSRFNTRSPR